MVKKQCRKQLKIRKTFYIFILLLMTYSICVANQISSEQNWGVFDNIGKTRAELLITEGPYETSRWLEDSQISGYEEIDFSARVVMGYSYIPIYAIENGFVVSSSFYLVQNKLLFGEGGISAYTALLEECVKEKLTDPKQIAKNSDGDNAFKRACMLVDTRYNVLIIVLSSKEHDSASVFIAISDRTATGPYAQRENAYYDLRIKAGMFDVDETAQP